MEKTIMKLDLNHQSAMFDVIQEILRSAFMEEDNFPTQVMAEIALLVAKINSVLFSENKDMKWVRKLLIVLASHALACASNIDTANMPDTGRVQVWYECDNCGHRSSTDTFFPKAMNQEGKTSKLIECWQCKEPLFVIKPKPKSTGE